MKNILTLKDVEAITLTVMQIKSEEKEKYEISSQRREWGYEILISGLCVTQFDFLFQSLKVFRIEKGQLHSAKPILFLNKETMMCLINKK